MLSAKGPHLHNEMYLIIHMGSEGVSSRSPGTFVLGVIPLILPDCGKSSCLKAHNEGIWKIKKPTYEAVVSLMQV